MYAVCEKCETKFLIEDELLGENGRKVRCGNCSHTWHQYPPSQEDLEKVAEVRKEQKQNLEEAKEKEEEGVKPSLPTVLDVKPMPIWGWAVAAVLLLVNIGVFVALNKPLIGVPAIYDTLGQYDTDDLAIGEISLLYKKEEGGGITYFMNWEVSNGSEMERSVPATRVRVLDKDMKQVLSSGVVKNEGVIEPGAVHKFKANRIPNPDKKGSYIEFDIGNPTDLSAR